MQMIKVIFLLLISLNLVVTVSCGVKGRPLPPEFPPQIGHGLSETSSSYSQDEDLKAIEIEKNKSQVPDKAEVKPPADTEGVIEKKPSANQNKKQKKAKGILKDKSTNIMDGKNTTSKAKSTTTTTPAPKTNEDPKK